MKKINKEQVLKICIQQQQELIENYNQRIDELKADTFKRNASASQTEDRRGGKVDILNALGKELSFAQKELTYLDQFDITAENTTVSPGAIVMTDQLNFFIAISTDKIEIDGTTIVGISANAPIYSSMKNLHKNNFFTFNERTYHIEDIY